MSHENEYANIDYIDLLNHEDSYEEKDVDSWLSVDVGEVELESPAADKVHDQQHKIIMTDDDVTLTQFCIPQPDQLDNPVGPTLSKHNFSSVDVGHPKARSFIYEASPTKIATYFGALDRANSGPDEKCRLPCPPEHCVPPANCGDAGGADSDDDELDLKISFMKFKAGSIALFVPVDATRKVWMAFHSNKPYHFLAQESLNFFLNRKAHSKQKCRILARIVYIEKHTVCTPLQPPHKGAMSCTQPVTSAPPPGSTHLPAMPALSGKSGSGGLDGGFGDVNVESVGCNFLFSPAAAPAVAAVESFTGAPARGHTTTGRTADREKEVSSNPYNLPPGTVYYECFAEPVTIVKYTK